MLANKYDRIVEQFKMYYPSMYEQATDWWPSGCLHITIKQEDGRLFEFNSYDNSIRRVRTDNYMNDSDALSKEIGYNLQKLVTSRGMAQNEIAERSGITPAMLSRYIHGTSMPGIDKLYNIAAVLGCRITDIIGDYYED